MSDMRWQAVDEVPGQLQAEILRGMLEAQGIKVALSQEGIGDILAATIVPMGRVQILVAEQDFERARELLDSYYAGTLTNDLNEPEPPFSGEQD